MASSLSDAPCSSECRWVTQEREGYGGRRDRALLGRGGVLAHEARNKLSSCSFL